MTDERKNKQDYADLIKSKGVLRRLAKGRETLEEPSHGSGYVSKIVTQRGYRLYLRLAP